MNSVVFFLLPIVMAITAGLTARILLYMVLYPLKPVTALGFTLHGLIIKNQRRIAEVIAAGMTTELAAGNISYNLVDAEKIKALEPTIETHLDNFLRIKLKEKMPVISAFIGESTIGKLKEGMMEEIALLLPEIIEKYSAAMLGNPAIGAAVMGKIEAYPAEKIEAHLAPYLRKAMIRIPVLFALGGLIAGVIFSVVAYLL